MHTLEESKKRVKLKRDLLEYKYKRLYEEWNNSFNDDRQLFCNVYQRLNDALDDMTEITNLTIWVGFNWVFREDEKELAEIKEHFTK